MVERWCDLHNLRKIDLCGGLHPASTYQETLLRTGHALSYASGNSLHLASRGYESVDLHHAHITAELNQRWPFGNGEIGVIRAHDALEHLRDPIHTMQEAHRCLTPHGWFLTLTPSTDGRGAFQDPTHVSFWNSNSSWYYTRPEQNRLIHSPIQFQSSRVKNFYPSD